MVKIKPKPFSLRTPVVTHKGSAIKPDLLLVIQDGITRVACLEETADLRKLIYQMESYTDTLKDMQWAFNQRQAKKGKK